MTRKDYVKLAAALLDSKPGPGCPGAAITQFFYSVYKIADALQADNPRFNRERFLLAAGA